MPTSQIFNEVANYTDAALPKAFRDPVLVSGSEFLFDFGDAYCLNGKVAGALANGAVFKNLVDGAPDAVLVLSAGDIPSIGAGSVGYDLEANGGVGGGISYLGLGDNYDHAVDAHAFYRSITFRIPAAGYSTGAYTSLFGQTNTNNNLAQFIFDTGAAGLNARGCIGWTSGGAGSQDSGNAIVLTPGTVVTVGLAWSTTGGLGTLTAFKDGAQVAQATDAKIATLNNPTAPIQLFHKAKHKTWRLFGEDLTVSGRTAAAAALADYQARVARGY